MQGKRFDAISGGSWSKPLVRQTTFGETAPQNKLGTLPCTSGQLDFHSLDFMQ